MRHGIPTLDPSTSKNWIYPTNYPVRNYQVDISQQALFTNTLVCLPTGLGKTLIAAVVIYNYYRWFPQGKVIFMAPTRPLVNQQMKACLDIMHIPSDHVAQLEGTISAEKRASLWNDHRVIFCTPQTAANDLQADRFDASSIVCVVFDEAHKATGGYAYATFMIEIWKKHQRFRVLALSATPGTDINRINQVVSTLKIAKIEIRTEDDPDVQPYVHNKQIEIIKCDEAVIPYPQQIKDEITQLLIRPVREFYAHQLIFSSQPSSLNRMVVNEIESGIKGLLEEGKLSSHAEKQLKDSLSFVKVLLDCRRIFQEEEAHGLLSFLDQKIRTIRMTSESNYQQLLKLYDLAKKSSVGSSGGIKSLEKRQPKIKKLKELLIQHFQDYSQRFGDGTNFQNANTRVLIFVHLRASVIEVKRELIGMPGIRPREFIGQGSSSSSNGETIGLTQAEQAQILKQFHAGEYNVLIATSIAEEGLDIAEVDLIVLLDSVASPTRLVQRCGRTGRKRAGRIVLITAPSSSSSSSSNLAGTTTASSQTSQGDDEDKLQQSYKCIRSLNELLKRANKTVSLLEKSPRMIPPDVPILYAEMTKDGMAISSTTSNSTAPITSYFPTALKACEAKSGYVSRISEMDDDLFAFNFSDNPASGTATIINSSMKQTVLSAFSNEKSISLDKPSQKYAEIIDITLSQPVEERGPAASMRTEFTVQSYRRHELKSSFFELHDNDLTDWSFEYNPQHEVDEPACFTSKQPNSCDQSKANSASKPLQLLPCLQSDQRKRMKSIISSRKADEEFIQLKDSEQDELSWLHTEPRSGSAPSNDWRNEETEPFIVNDPSSSRIDFEKSILTDPAQSNVKGLKERETPIPHYFLSLSRSHHDLHDNSTMTVDYCHPSPVADNSKKLFVFDEKKEIESDAYDFSYWEPEPPKQKRENLSKTKKLVISDPSLAYSARLNEKSASSDTKLKHNAKANKSGSSFHNNDDGDAIFCSVCLETNQILPKSCGIHSSEDEDNTSQQSEEDPPPQIVTCGGICKQSFHPDCYGLQLVDSDEEDPFSLNRKIMCDYCLYRRRNKLAPTKVCVLCQQSSGLLKLSTCKQWTHQICVLFTAELTLDDDCRPNNLAKLDPDRQVLMCAICRRRGGAVVQCKYLDCMEGFHPYCLLKEKRGQMVVWKRRKEYHYDLFCPKHTTNLPDRHLIVSSLSPLPHLLNKEAKTEHDWQEITPLKAFTPVKKEDLVTLSQLELLDTDEKAPNLSKKFGLQSKPPSTLAFLQKEKKRKLRLQSNNPRGQNEKSEERHRLKQLLLRRENNLYSKKFHNTAVQNCFDLEAVVAVGDSEDDESKADRKFSRGLVNGIAFDEEDGEEDDNSDHSSDVLSGDFINDGAYTQPSPSAFRTQDEYAMYLNADRIYHEKRSPQVTEETAIEHVADLVLRKNHKMYRMKVGDVYSVENTPDRENRKRKRLNPSNMNVLSWKTSKARRRKERWSDEEQDEDRSSPDDAEQEDLDQYDESFVVDDSVVIYDSDYRASQEAKEDDGVWEDTPDALSSAPRISYLTSPRFAQENRRSQVNTATGTAAIPQPEELAALEQPPRRILTIHSSKPKTEQQSSETRSFPYNFDSSISNQILNLENVVSAEKHSNYAGALLTSTKENNPTCPPLLKTGRVLKVNTFKAKSPPKDFDTEKEAIHVLRSDSSLQERGKNSVHRSSNLEVRQIEIEEEF